MIQKQQYIKVEVNGEQKELISNSWSPQKCFSRLPKIGKAFAVPMSMLMKGGSEEGFAEVLPEVLFMLFTQMEEQDVWELFTMITEDVHVSSTERLNLDVHFGNDLGAILNVVGATLKQNYGSLFSGKGLSSLMESMMGVTQVAQVG